MRVLIAGAVSCNPDLLIGAATAPLYGQGFIATPGGVDTHVHLVQPRLIPVALSAGMTTLMPGTWANQASRLCECWAAAPVPDPAGARITSGT